ncbi:MAG TPA: DUF4166 domain-containing protein [Tahibacter sp.]|uniref:DUF4166 domain-containing protein n=1 Tax=Tahibacter sp. TaxID=2056211 RepID=UPI002CFF8AD9|nr:DUF4166 domain-containing protein [Tahibacter sp.]HSX62553.1 DUF4166 domain-containing protein [Tahibacter sp.]
MPAAGHGAETVVTRWFGDSFSQLHPLLQTLHRRGGRLSGRIAVDCGRGAAGVLGRRLARGLGIPADRTECGFEVRIVHRDDALIWSRRFDNGGEMVSSFVPYGKFPGGGWLERTGPLTLDLGVDVRDGGWHWALRGARWHGLPVPLALLPRSQAGKRIVDGRYAFEVEFCLPIVGRVLRYSGMLEAETGGE